jgi:hypothetical protein
MAQELTNLEQLLDKIEGAAVDEDEISLGKVVHAVGARSFGPLLLMAGLVMTSPLSGVPGVPTTMGVLVLLIAVQMLLGRHCFWLPKWMLNRSVKRGRLQKALGWARRPAKFVDRWSSPRLTGLVQRGGACTVAVVCVVFALGLPLMELVPFSATLAGVAYAAFGLSLITRDGYLGLIAFALAATGIGVVIFQLAQ